MLKVLIDECCPRALVAALTDCAFDVAAVAQICPGATDDALVLLAKTEGRLIVTQDYDFGDMAIRRGLSGPGVVLVACLSLPPLARVSRTAEAMTSLADRLFGHITIIEAERVRQRPLAISG